MTDALAGAPIGLSALTDEESADLEAWVNRHCPREDPLPGDDITLGLFCCAACGRCLNIAHPHPPCQPHDCELGSRDAPVDLGHPRPG